MASSSEQTALLNRSETERLVGLTSKTIYAMMKRGEFPRPVRLGRRFVRWRRSDLESFLENLPTVEYTNGAG